MQTVMIVEDDVMIADMLSDMLIDGGYNVCSSSRTVENAVECANKFKPDLCILDLILAKGGFGHQVVTRMNKCLHPGILYATGNNSLFALTSDNGHAVITKPYRSSDMLHSLEIVTELLATGNRVNHDLPRGFIFLEKD
jgi:DNA-binding response OmpR family regulator